MIMTFITAPYKALADEKSGTRIITIIWCVAPPFILASAAVILYFEGALPLAGPRWQGLQWWLHGHSTTLCLPLAEVAFAQFVAVYAFCSSWWSQNRIGDGHGIFGWILLLYIPGMLVVYQHSRVGIELLAMHLFLLGFVVERLGISGRFAVGECISGYWLFVLLCCSCLAMPIARGATDYQPSEHFAVRACWSAVTIIMIAAFLCAGDSIRDPFKLFARFPGLKYWVLFLYTAHIAIHKLVPNPFNWLVLITSILPFLLRSPPHAQAHPDEEKPILKEWNAA
jgi:hypothetical protein